MIYLVLEGWVFFLVRNIGFWAPDAYSMAIRENSDYVASKYPIVRDLIYKSSDP